MLKIIKFATLPAILVLGGCAGPPPAPGTPAEAVKARLGSPTAIYPLPEGQEWEYAHGPMGQETFMASFGPDGKLQRYEQVLTGEKFATIKVDQATTQDVLRTLGRPAKKSYLPLRDLEVWSYRYKENGVWDSMMHVHFDRQGVVRQMMNGPDPRNNRFW